MVHSIRSNVRRQKITGSDLEMGQVMIVDDSTITRHNGKYLMKTKDGIANLSDPSETWYNTTTLEGDLVPVGTVITITVGK